MNVVERKKVRVKIEDMIAGSFRVEDILYMGRGWVGRRGERWVRNYILRILYFSDGGGLV